MARNTVRAGKRMSLYLSERTINLARGEQSLSKAIDQIVDRYTELVRLDRHGVREHFSAGAWAILSAGWRLTADDVVPAVGARAALLRAAENQSAVADEINQMTTGQVMVLVEMLQAEHAGMSAPPA